MSISQTIRDFTILVIRAGGWMEIDRLYLQNRLLRMVGEDTLESIGVRPIKEESADLLNQLVAKVGENGILSELPVEQGTFETRLVDFLTLPLPVVNAFFAQHYSESPEEATEYFFNLSKKNDYIKTRTITKNIKFPAESEYGELKITINLSKPEKDPKQIATEREAVEVDYPVCMLCMENEEYKGRLNYPIHTDHRIIRMSLDGEGWGFQYFPYAYYNEHSTILPEQHRPMKITKETLARLSRIAGVLPHYSVGSSADLPAVEGSALSHDHYRAGRYEFSMAKAPIERFTKLEDHPQVIAGVVKWPMFVIRLQPTERNLLIEAANSVLEKWEAYSDEIVSIGAFSAGGTLHHTIAPIVRRRDNHLELDLVLRDNNVSEEHPDGISHPHKNVQHIKKENIGLAEVMGLAVLPPRLKPELVEVKHSLLGKGNQMTEYHHPWVEQLKKGHLNLTKDTIIGVVQKSVGQVFAYVLEDAGVFKRDEKGQAAFERLVAAL